MLHDNDHHDLDAVPGLLQVSNTVVCHCHQQGQLCLTAMDSDLIAICLLWLQVLEEDTLCAKYH